MAVTVTTRLSTGYSAGTRMVEVDDMSGWHPGDVIAIRATVGKRAVSRRAISAIVDQFIVLDGGLQSDHPTVIEKWGTIVDKQWMVQTAAVVNLTAKIRARQPRKARNHRYSPVLVDGMN